MENYLFDYVRPMQYNLPEPPGLTEYLEKPGNYRPKAEFLSAQYLIEDDTVLTHAVKNTNVPAVESLLAAGADPNLPSRKGIAPISAAAHKGNTDIMRYLIAAGADVNSQNSTGSTALIQAAHFGHVDAVALLLDSGALADASNQKGTTALMRACQEGHLKITEILIRASVDVNKKNHEGMNALMLASQRGHAQIVWVLVKAGAVMDEQTQQGSTALMLACKRGHEKCAEVLVSLGAEIFMRDRRGRTARDTALRRSHTGLLCWLDTQMQVRKVEYDRARVRDADIANFRAVYQRQQGTSAGRKLNLFIPPIASIQALSDAATRNLFGVSTEKDNRLCEEFLDRSCVMSIAAARSAQLTISTLQESLRLSHAYNDKISNIPVYRNTLKFAKKPTGYAEWQWPFLFEKCLTLPPGIFESIMEYMPMPRVWQWSLLRLKRRCKLAPHQALFDIGAMMDEILRDSALFAGSDQRNLCMRITRSPQIHDFLLEDLKLPPQCLEAICSFGDAQSILQSCNEKEVLFKPMYARRMLNGAADLYRWFRHRCSPMKFLMLNAYVPPPPELLMAQQQGGGAAFGPNAQLLRILTMRNARRGGLGGSGGMTSNDEMDDGEEGVDMECTDIAGEEAEEDFDDDENSDFEGDFVPADQDTETELAMEDVEGAAQEMLDDSDSDDGAPQQPTHGHHH